MPIHDIQSSFAGGEISPGAHARVDLQKYKISCKTMRNFIPGPHGEAYNRPGTRYVASAKYGTKAARVIPFVVSNTQSYVLEFGDQYIRFYRNGGQILTGGVTYEISSPYLEADLFALKFAQSADTLYISHPSYAPRTLTRVADSNWSLALYAFQKGPFMVSNTNTNEYILLAGGVIELIPSGDLGGADIGTLVRLNVSVASQVVNYDYSVASASTNITVGSGGTWRFVTTGTWTGTIVVEMSTDNGSTWSAVFTAKSTNNLNANTFGTIANDGDTFLMRVNATVLSSGIAYTQLSCDAYEDYALVQITSIINSTKANVTVLRAAAALPLTNDFAFGSWSTLRGWPAAVAFCQDRLVWGGTPTEPQTEWMTKTSNYTDFGRSSPLVDSDGITVNLTGRQLNPIKHLVNFLNALVAFTSATEHSTIGSSGDMTPSSVQTKMQGTRGTNDVPPVVIGHEIIFISPLGSSVRQMVYQFYTDVFQSQNISLIADHLFKGYTIVDMAYQQEPDSLLWLVRSDGTLLCLTYIPEQEMIAWSRHDTVGTFESVCTIPGSGANEVWFVVKRGSNRYIERMIQRTVSTDPADQYFVDCGIPYSGAPASSLSGYSHLNGSTVAINAGGFVKPQQVVSGGVVSLGGTYSKAQIGLPYICDLETLNPEFQVQNGTLQDRKYQIAKATFRFLNTAGGFAGPDLSTLDDLANAAQPPQRDASLDAATPTPLFTGFQTIPMPRADDQHGHVAFRQVDPMPVTIVSIFPIVAPGENP